MNSSALTAGHRVSLPAILGWRQILFVLTAVLTAVLAEAAQLREGNNYSLSFTDIDRHKHSTADGHVTAITVVTRRDEPKAETVGERISQITLGDPKFRLITLVNFQQNIFPPLRGMVSAIIRNRLTSEAAEVQKKYDQRQIKRNARDDIFVVADFDGKAVSQFGIEPTSSEFAVFVFDGKGRLVRRWSDVPSLEALAQALKEAR
ncbi:MAG TPA: hypothetical protein VM940_09275 [Chthoniobacterales bacterium]|nr:hypothetical protein [Chthoniobacterales bacterium]